MQSADGPSPCGFSQGAVTRLFCNQIFNHRETSRRPHVVCTGRRLAGSKLAHTVASAGAVRGAEAGRNCGVSPSVPAAASADCRLITSLVVCSCSRGECELKGASALNTDAASSCGPASLYVTLAAWRLELLAPFHVQRRRQSPRAALRGLRGEARVPCLCSGCRRAAS